MCRTELLSETTVGGRLVADFLGGSGTEGIWQEMPNVYKLTATNLRKAESGKRKLARKVLIRDQKADGISRLKRGGDVATVADALGASPSAVKRTRPTKVRDSDATTTDGKAVAVRLSPEEVAALDALQGCIGASSRSDALRALVRSSVGMLELPAEDAARIAETKSELHKIGVNVNQIALAANRGRIDMARHEWGAINELRQALPGLRTWLRAVVDENRRRGIRLFRAFMEAEHGAGR